MPNETTPPKDHTPAFPYQGNSTFNPELGMELRDYFAGQALLALLGDSDVYVAMNNIAKNGGVEVTFIASKAAYGFADAMMEARKV